jgi:type III secretion protein V
MPWCSPTAPVSTTLPTEAGRPRIWQTVAPALDRFLQRASRRTDLVFASFTLLSVVMIILPLPTFMVDALIGVNIALTLLVLVVAFYAGRPVEFSSLPSLLLISTLFRIALSITTTRLILRNGDAGEIVSAFGEFVVGGQVIIGLVIFLVITVAQFVVITKGAERVAEVAARFSLDALPGKQMSIDNDLRNGDIDAPQARQLRKLLEQESQLFGAMDGAMKFVKGDAIASLVILAVNLLGGLGVGVISHGMSLLQAGHTYAILSVGDGLVAQIPSLLTALAAGLIVTRVASVQRRDLSTELLAQLTGNDRPLWLTAGLLALLSLVPGFPTLTFIGLAGVLGTMAYLARRRRAIEVPAEPPAPVADPATWDFQVGTGRPVRITVHLDTGLCAGLDLDLTRASAQLLHDQMEKELGVDLPDIAWRPYVGSAESNMRIDVDESPVARYLLPTGCVRLPEHDPAHSELAELIEGPALQYGRPTYWLPVDAFERADVSTIPVQPPEAAILAFIRRTASRHAAEFIGVQETHQWLQKTTAWLPELVAEATRLLPVPRLAAVLRPLLDDGVPLANARAVLEAIIESSAHATETQALCRKVREALGRLICHQHADAEGLIQAVVIDYPLESAIRKASQTRTASMVPIPNDMAQALAARLRLQLRSLHATPMVLATADDIRERLHQLMRAQNIDIAVLAFSDPGRGYAFHPIANIGVSADEGSPT